LESMVLAIKKVRKNKNKKHNKPTST